MDVLRKAADPCLVCTCNDLYIDEIEEVVAFGEQEYREIFSVLGTQPRCGECIDHVATLVEKMQ